MADPETDLWCVRACACGDEDALRRLVATHQRLVFGIARRLLRNAEDAEEVTTATFLKVWRSASSFRGECSVKAYVCRIAINLCRDRAAKPRLVSVPCPEEASPDPRFEQILAAMATMPVADREALVLYYLDEMDYAEICQALDVSYDVLKTRLVRARKRLRQLMETLDV